MGRHFIELTPAEDQQPTGFEARFNLGLMLKDGRGVEEPDPLEALVWLGLAARIGHEGATRARTELETMTDPEVVRRARALISER